MLPVETPFKIYTGLTGQPLNNGYVYFGTANQNPITSPITVYWDAAGTQPAAQPLRTVNGYIVRAGTPANVFVGVSYSELVKDSTGQQVFYARNSDDFSIGTVIINFLATLAASGGSVLIGFIQAGIGAIARTAQAKLRERLTTEDFSTNPVTGAAAATAAIKVLDGGAFATGSTNYTLANGAPIQVFGGVGYAVRYDHKYAKTTSPNTTTNAFEFGNITGMVAASYRNEYTIENITAIGAGTGGTSAGIKQIDAANIRIRGALIQGFNKGLHLYSGLSSSYYDMTLTLNGYGVYAEAGTGLTLAEPNANSFYGCRIYGNDRCVEYIGAANASVLWCGCNFEGNNLAGNPADGRAIINLQLTGQQTFISTHHEGNLGQYGIYYTGADQTKTLTMVGVEHIDSTDTQVHIQTGCFLGLGSRIFGNTSTRQLYFNTGASGTLIESETTPSGDLSNLAVIRFGKLRFGGNSVSSSACISATAEAVNNASGGTVTDFSSDSFQHIMRNAAGTRIGYTGYYNVTDFDYVADSVRGWNFWSNSAKIVSIGRGGALTFEPGSDNSITFGSASFRAKELFSANGTVNTSDEREKEWLGNLNAAQLSAAKEIAQSIGHYQWLSSIAEKGKDGARMHIGVKAQQVIRIMAAHGLDPMRYGFVCYDEWDDVMGKSPTADGEDAGPMVVVQPAGNRYGIRADQLAFFIAAAQEQRLAALERLVMP